MISGQDSVLNVRGERDIKFPMTRVSVIGCRYCGPQLIRNFAAMANAQLLGVADKRQDRLNYVRSQYGGLRTYTDHPALLASDVEAVVVATPIHSHFTIARDALLAGKHVLVGKPLCSSVAESLELLGPADDGQLILIAGHPFLYNQAVAELAPHPARPRVRHGLLRRHRPPQPRAFLAALQRDLGPGAARRLDPQLHPRAQLGGGERVRQHSRADQHPRRRLCADRVRGRHQCPGPCQLARPCQGAEDNRGR